MRYLFFLRLSPKRMYLVASSVLSVMRQIEATVNAVAKNTVLISMIAISTSRLNTIILPGSSSWVAQHQEPMPTTRLMMVLRANQMASTIESIMSYF